MEGTTNGFVWFFVSSSLRNLKVSVRCESLVRRRTPFGQSPVFLGRSQSRCPSSVVPEGNIQSRGGGVCPVPSTSRSTGPPGLGGSFRRPPYARRGVERVPQRTLISCGLSEVKSGKY